MIFAVEWFLRKRAIAAPDRRLLFPISRGSNPNFSFPPNNLQVDLIRSSVYLLLMYFPLWKGEWIVHTGVSGDAPGTCARTRCTPRPNRITGQRKGCSVFLWVRRSIVSPFFWSSNTTVMNLLRRSSSGWLCGIIFRFLSRKMRHRRRAILVRPGVGVWTYSHERMAMKNAPMMRSTTWPSGVLAIISRLASFDMLRSKRGVTALCRFSGGDTLTKYLNRLVRNGMNLLPSCW